MIKTRKEEIGCMYLDKIGETLVQYCEQNPIRLNYEKLCSPQASKIHTTTTQLGWLFAVIEFKAMSFDSIEWTQGLMDRAIELRISYSILAHEQLKEDHNNSRKPLWVDDIISVKKHNNACDYDVIVNGCLKTPINGAGFCYN